MCLCNKTVFYLLCEVCLFLKIKVIIYDLKTYMAWIFIPKKKKVIGHVWTRAQGSNYGTIIYIYIYILSSLWVCLFLKIKVIIYDLKTYMAWIFIPKKKKKGYWACIDKSPRIQLWYNNEYIYIYIWCCGSYKKTNMLLSEWKKKPNALVSE